MNDRVPLLEIIGVRKDFPGVRALNDVSFDLIPGEVHFLIGENGAGKSTLVNILSGAYPPDRGHLVLDGHPIRLTPSSAIELGIHTLHQEPALVGDLSVAANIFLGREREPGRYGWLLDERQLRRRAAATLASLHESLDPSSLIRDLSIADRQMVAIAKALSGHLRFLVLDEPTAPLNPVEIRRLTDLVLRLVKQGIGVVYVSHHLEEVSAFGDRATILRDGSVVATVPAKDTPQSELIRLMVGRELKEQFPKVTVAPGEVMLRVHELSVAKTLANVTLSVSAGEILGVAGLPDSGRGVLARALAGLHPAESGTVWLDGKQVNVTSPAKAKRLGIAFLPADRKREALILDRAVRENITLSTLHSLAVLSVIRPERERQAARQQADRLDIRPRGIERLVRLLSGGNQQKVSLARALCSGARLLIFEEPTAGVDVGAKVEIYRLMGELVKNGAAIIMISSELPEILGLADRILVMSHGRVSGVFNRDDANEHLIMERAFAAA
jgi:ABC-type sugar transport system ATPase subunit